MSCSNPSGSLLRPVILLVAALATQVRQADAAEPPAVADLSLTVAADMPCVWPVGMTPLAVVPVIWDGEGWTKMPATAGTAVAAKRHRAAARLRIDMMTCSPWSQIDLAG
jgi:hypothetical protein